GAKPLRAFCHLNGLRRRITPGADNHGNLAFGLFDNDSEHPVCLVVVQRRAFPSCPARQKHVDAALNLKIDETAERPFIDRAVRCERRYHRRACSLKAFLCHRSTSSIVKMPLRPRSHLAAARAPSAKPRRFFATCFSSMRSASESKPTVCVPATTP